MPGKNEAISSHRDKSPVFDSSYDVVKLTISFADLSAVDPGAAWRWLSDYLSIDPPVWNVDPSDRRAMITFQRLYLASVFLRAARIPIFETPSIVGIASSESGLDWQAKIRFPWLKGISLNALTLSLQGSEKLLQKISAATDPPLDRAEIYAWIKMEVTDRILPFAPPGKSMFHILGSAYANKIPFSHLGSGTFLLGTGSRSRLIRGSTTEGDSAISVVVAQDKEHTNHLLRGAGLPVPPQKSASSVDDAVRVSQELTWPLVVKPSHLDRGEGVFINITNKKQLVDAANHVISAYKGCKVIIEEMQAGFCHRLVIVNQQLVYAVIRLPVAVFGDGRSTIRELIERAHQDQQNQPPWHRSGNHYQCDSLTEQILASSGTMYSAVPEHGQIVNLRAIESTQWGGRDEDLTNSVHPDNVALALAAADALRLSIAGVDIMSSDLTVPWYSNKATINEVNSSPSIGAGPTSRRYLSRFLHCLIGENPSIPIERFDQRQFSIKAARSLQEIKRKEGLRSFIVSPVGCFDEAGHRIPCVFKGVRECARALLRNRNVDHLILIE